MLAHVDEAIPCLAEVAGIMEAEAVKDATAVPTVICGLDAAVAGLPVADFVLQGHILIGR
jgi:hypothetical protein